MPDYNKEYDTALNKEQKAVSKTQRSLNKVLKPMMAGLSSGEKDCLKVNIINKSMRLHMLSTPKKMTLQTP